MMMMMTSEELYNYDVWECTKDGYVEYFRTDKRKIIKAGPQFENLVGRSTGTAKQILRGQGWSVNVYSYNREGTSIGRS